MRCAKSGSERRLTICFSGFNGLGAPFEPLLEAETFEALEAECTEVAEALSERLLWQLCMASETSDLFDDVIGLAA